MTTQLIPFNFNQRKVRVLNLEGDPWFVAKDVAEEEAVLKMYKDALGMV